MISTFILVCEVILLFLVCEFDAIKNVKFPFLFHFCGKGELESNPFIHFYCFFSVLLQDLIFLLSLSFKKIDSLVRSIL